MSGYISNQGYYAKGRQVIDADKFYVTTDDNVGGGGNIDITQVVDLSSNQDISGVKTFTQTISGDITGNAATATKLASSVTIAGVEFDGSVAIDLSGVTVEGNQNTTGNAATATKLASARSIAGVNFDGTSNIDIPGVNTTGDLSGNATTATKLATARSIAGVSFDGTSNINIPGVNTTGDLSGNAATVTNGVYTTGSQTIAGVKTFTQTISGDITGNATTATSCTTSLVGDINFVNSSGVTKGALSYKTDETYGAILTAHKLVATTNAGLESLSFDPEADQYTMPKLSIGTTSSSYPLHIQSDSLPQLFIQGATNSDAVIKSGSGPSFTNNFHQIRFNHYQSASGNEHNNSIDFEVNAGEESTPTTRMTIRGDGYVGISGDTIDISNHMLSVKHGNTILCKNTGVTPKISLLIGGDNVGIGNEIYASTNITPVAQYNVAIGTTCLKTITSGTNNIAIGLQSQGTTSGSNNISMGTNSLGTNTTGSYNTCIGPESGKNNKGSSGSNTFLGYGADIDIDYSNNIISGSTAIGNGAKITQSNQIVLGTATETVKVPGFALVKGLVVENSETSVDANARCMISYNEFTKGGIGQMSFFIANDDSQLITTPKFIFRAHESGVYTDMMVLNTTGLTVNGNTVAYVATSSDDRIKHNERPIEHALETIRVLEPLRYFKTHEMYDASHNFALDASGQPIDISGNVVSHTIEEGLIAQELVKIDALKDFVKVPEDPTKKYSVNYNSIFVHSIKALQELDIVHTRTKTELEQTKQKLSDMETLLESALSRITALES